MFSFFKRKKKEAKKAKKRDLFNELFPLSAETKQQIEKAVNDTQTKMHGEEGAREIRNYTRNYDSAIAQLQHLEFDFFNWTLHESTDVSQIYYDEHGDTLDLIIIDPNGEMRKETAESEMPVYRDWLRNLAAKEGGGLIHSEHIQLKNGLTGTESIIKIPRQEATGMDYTYFLNLHHYDDQKLYQLVIRIHEASPTGMRDNIFLFPLSTVVGSEVLDMPELYRSDPYDKEFSLGNTMNISERAEFDYLFPFHPLSIIRREIAPQLKQTLTFLK